MIGKERPPYFIQPFGTSIDNVAFLARMEGQPPSVPWQADGADLILNPNDGWQMCSGETSDIGLNTRFRLTVADSDHDKLPELLLVAKNAF